MNTHGFTSPQQDIALKLVFSYCCGLKIISFTKQNAEKVSFVPIAGIGDRELEPVVESDQKGQAICRESVMPILGMTGRGLSHH